MYLDEIHGDTCISNIVLSLAHGCDFHFGGRFMTWHDSCQESRIKASQIQRSRPYIMIAHMLCTHTNIDTARGKILCEL